MAPGRALCRQGIGAFGKRAEDNLVINLSSSCVQTDNDIASCQSLAARVECDRALRDRREDKFMKIEIEYCGQ